MKYYILYNPEAGHGKSDDKINHLKALYGEESVLYDITKIENYNEFMATLVSEDVIVIAGGDGTLNRFINDVDGITIENEILYYPTGTGNDFVRDLAGDGITGEEPFSVKEYIRDLPFVEVNGKKYRFLNGVGYGIDGYCCEVGDELRKKSDKPVNYTSIAIKGILFHFRPTTATVTVDGKKYVYKKVWLAPTMNGRFYGGGIMPTPEQDRHIKGGEVSTMIWHDLGKIRTLLAFPSIFKGEHVKREKNIAIHRGREITVEFDRPVALQVDGETILNVTSYKVTAAVTADIK